MVSAVEFGCSVMAGSVLSVRAGEGVGGAYVETATMYVPENRFWSCHAQNGGDSMVTCCPLVSGR